eukprot:jgi/Galph1/3213/GphlegSOOS_G1836.1
MILAFSFGVLDGKRSLHRSLSSKYYFGKNTSITKKNIRVLKKTSQAQLVSCTSSEPSSWSYARAGVDIDLEATSVGALVNSFRHTLNGKDPRQNRKYGQTSGKSGQFAGLIDFDDKLLALTTDGVGSKLSLAAELNYYETVAIDCVAMNVNDLLCVGAEPIAFVDYIAAPRAKPDVWASLGTSLAHACRKARVNLCGGETATLPDIVKELDMSGTALGWLPKDQPMTSEYCSPGDLILALPSSGFHSNGYSLIRAVLKETKISLSEDIFLARIHRFDSDQNKPLTIGEVLLNPTTIYVDPLVELFQSCRETQKPCPFASVRGAINITGGGLTNFLRLQPGKLGFEIIDPLPVLPEFLWIQKLGNISNEEMYRTFNMGMGFALLVEPEAAPLIQEWLQEHHMPSKIVGLVNSTGKISHPEANVSYERY